MEGLVFDEEHHRYKLDGVVIPGVTSILSTVLGGGERYSDLHRDRGTAVHRACQFHDEGALDEGSVAELVYGYLTGWKKFIAESGAIVVDIELSVVSRRYGFAGTLDRTLRFPGKDDLHIVDIKSGNPMPEAALQLAGYWLAYREMTGVVPSDKRLVVKLGKEGTYKIHTYNNKGDYDTFLAFTRVARWKEMNGK